MPNSSFRTIFYSRSLLSSLETLLSDLSVTSVLFSTLPIIATTLLLALFCTLFSDSQPYGLRSHFVECVCYGTGVQLVLILLKALAVTVYAWIKKIQWQGAAVDERFLDVSHFEQNVYHIIMQLFAVAIHCGAAPIFYAYFRSRRKRPEVLISTGRVIIAIILSAIFVEAAALGASLRVSRSIARMLDRAVPGDYIGIMGQRTARLLSSSVSPTTGELSLTILALNQSDEELILTRTVDWVRHLKLTFVVGSPSDPKKEEVTLEGEVVVTEWEAGDDPVMRVAPGQNAWLVLGITPESSGAAESWDRLSKVGQRAGSPRKAIIEFSVVLEEISAGQFYLNGKGEL